jgi:hypothetical protein
VPNYLRFIPPLSIAAALALPAAATSAKTSNGSCTMAEASTRVTVEVEIPNAHDFCELVSRALASEVFRSSVLVTPGLLWHHADAPLSCRLGYGRTHARMEVHDSPAACRWLSRLAPRWHFEPMHDEAGH